MEKIKMSFPEAIEGQVRIKSPVRLKLSEEGLYDTFVLIVIREMTPTFPLDAKYVEIHGCEHERKSFTMSANKHWGFVLTLRGENSVHLKFSVPGTYLTTEEKNQGLTVHKAKHWRVLLFTTDEPVQHELLSFQAVVEPRPKLKRPLDADSSGLTSKRRSPCSSTTTLEISTTEEDAIKEFQNFLREQRRGWPSEFHDRAVSVALAQARSFLMSAKEIYKMSSADGNNYDDDNDNSSELTSESSPPDLPVDLSQYKREHEKAAADGLLSLSTTQK